jgi:predicted ATP-dependent serine protease
MSRQGDYQQRMIVQGRCAVCGRKRKKYKRHCAFCQHKISLRENERQKKKRREKLGLLPEATRQGLLKAKKA